MEGVEEAGEADGDRLRPSGRRRRWPGPGGRADGGYGGQVGGRLVGPGAAGGGRAAAGQLAEGAVGVEGEPPEAGRPAANRGTRGAHGAP